MEAMMAQAMNLAGILAENNGKIDAQVMNATPETMAAALGNIGKIQEVVQDTLGTALAGGNTDMAAMMSSFMGAGGDAMFNGASIGIIDSSIAMPAGFEGMDVPVPEDNNGGGNNNYTPPVSGDTHILTTGADTLIGGSGDDMFVGVFDNSDGLVSTVNSTVVASASVTDVAIQGHLDTTETHALTFHDLIAGQSVTVDGLTLTAAGSINAHFVALAFQNLAASATASDAAGTHMVNGTYSGALSAGWSSSTATDAAVTFTSTTPSTNVTDIAVTSAGVTVDTPVAAPAAVGQSTTQGHPSATETNVLTFPDLIAGQSVSVGGLTLTTSVDISAANVAGCFASINDGGGSHVGNASFTWSGALSGWSSGDVDYDTNSVTFTSTTPGANVDNIAITTAGVAGVADPADIMDVITPSGASVAETHTLTFQDLIAGQSVTVDGATLTATGAIAAAAVATGFGTMNGVTSGTWSGSFSSNWVHSSHSGATATFTSFMADLDVMNIPFSSAGTTGVDAPTIGQTTTPGVAAATENNTLTFQDLIAGQSVTVNGLTLTATGDIAAAAVAAGFASLTANATTGAAVTNGAWSGGLSGWSSSTATNAAVTFTSTTPGTNVDNIAVTSAGIADTPAPTAVGDTAGNASTIETHTLTFQNLIAGQSVTVDGLTWTVAENVDAYRVAQAFQGLTASATASDAAAALADIVNINGTFSGHLSAGWSSGIANYDTYSVVFTSTTPGAVSDIVVTSAGMTGDTINGGGGTNTLEIAVTDAYYNTLDLSNTNITNVQNLVINDTTGSDFTVNLATGNTFANVTLNDVGYGEVNGINEGTSATVAATGDNSNSVYSYLNFNETTATTVTMNDTVQGASGLGSYVEGDFYHGDRGAGLSNATTINATLNLQDTQSIDGSGEGYAYQYIYADNTGNVATDITVNLNATNNSSDGSSSRNNNAEIDIYQNGDATVTANINMTDTADTWTVVYAQEDNQATNTTNNTANITLNNVTDSRDHSGVGAYDFATVNIDVTGDAVLNGMYFYEQNSTQVDTNSQTVTITADADLKSSETDLNNYGSTATIVSGSGNVDLGYYYASSSSTLSDAITATIDASALNGDFSVFVERAVTSVTGGAGDDTIAFANGKLGMGVTVSGGTGEDTIGMSFADYSHITWSTFSAATSFEKLAIADTWANISNPANATALSAADSYIITDIYNVNEITVAQADVLMNAHNYVVGQYFGISDTVADIATGVDTVAMASYYIVSDTWAHISDAANAGIMAHADSYEITDITDVANVTVAQANLLVNANNYWNGDAPQVTYSISDTWAHISDTANASIVSSATGTVTVTTLANGALPETSATYHLGDFANNVTGGTNSDTVALGSLTPTGTIALGAGANHVTIGDNGDISGATITAASGTADLVTTGSSLTMSTEEYNLFSPTGIHFDNAHDGIGTITFTTAGTITSNSTATTYVLATGAANNALALAIDIDLSGTNNYAHLQVGAAGANYATAPSNVISNAAAHDNIIFKNDTNSAASSVYSIATSGTVADDITAILAAVTGVAHGVVYVVSGGNTYVAESQTGTLGATDTTLIELTGAHTFDPYGAGGQITVA
jgi:riboflavin synthase alpha subunit